MFTFTLAAGGGDWAAAVRLEAFDMFTHPQNGGARPLADAPRGGAAARAHAALWPWTLQASQALCVLSHPIYLLSVEALLRRTAAGGRMPRSPCGGRAIY